MRILCSPAKQILHKTLTVNENDLLMRIGPTQRRHTLITAAKTKCTPKRWAVARAQGAHSELHGSVRGPSFLMEPPTRLEFSNSTGGRLDCTATGSPPPSVSWVTGDGTRVGDVGAVRRVEANGSLILLPFAAAAYRQDVHSATYRCVAANAVGAIISREVLVRAVVTQAYSVEASSEQAPRGCTAVLRCSPPSFVRDLVHVVSWTQEPSRHIYPSQVGDGKHWMLPTGELLVSNVEYADSFPRYWCRTRHRLTNQLVTSSPTVIRVTEQIGDVAPIILQQTSSVHAALEESARLLCLALGCPEPVYSWQLLNLGHGLGPGLGSPRAKVLGPLLELEAASPEDAGTYRCTARNPAGEASADMRLSVYTPLEVDVEPALLVVQVGGSAEFRCQVSSPGGLVTWYKDGAPVLGGGTGLLVLGAVSREDRGMYQCVVRRAEGDTAQAAAELRLGDAAPVLQYSFIEQTLQPGPSVSLKCSAAGQPTPTISWSLDGFPLPTNHRFLIGQYVTVHGDVISHVNISHVTVEDGGEYRCIAENRAGRAHHAARLNVYGLPYIRQIPKVTAVAGETMEIKCPVAGYPIEEIKWERGSTELPRDLRQKVTSSGVLVVERVQKSTDGGLYTCTARNKQSHTARRSAEVEVIAPPKLSPFGPSLSAHEGERASLTCSVVSGDPPLRLQWLKDGLPLDTVHRVDEYNSILLIENLSREHNGSYTCAASNAAAEVTQTQELLVNVPPVIEPFKFQDGLSEGMRTRTVCGVSRGDTPLSIHWLKDGEPLGGGGPGGGPGGGASVSQLDQYASILSIPHLSASHSGQFTCVASNAAAEVRYTAELSVKVPPTWEVEPQDASVERGRAAHLQCRARGVPPPTTVWKKATGGRNGEYQELRELRDRAPSFRVLANGTLVLQSVTEDTEGFYLCQANNSIGSPLGKVVQLKVNSRPYFAAPSRLISVKRGETAVLRCDVSGDRPISVVWTRAGMELTPATNYRVSVREEPRRDGLVAELLLASSESADSGAYHCQAKNQFGVDKQLVQLQVQEPPPKPVGLQTALVSSQSLNLQWQHSGAPGQDAESLRFIVEYRQQQQLQPGVAGAAAGAAAQWKRVDVRGQHAAVISDLRPATRYVLRVFAEGAAGRSEPSAELLVRTEPQRPAGAPLGLTARALSSTAVLLTWSAPAPELRHGDITSYNVGFRVESGQTAYNMTSVVAEPGDSDDDGELKLSGLLKFTRYSIVVQAVNVVGVGPMSDAVSVSTLEDVPSSPPEEVRCHAVNSQSLQVSWQPPPSGSINGVLQGYSVQYESVVPDLRHPDPQDTAKTTALLVVLLDLRKATNHSVTVRAYTRKGEGVASRPVFCSTEEDAPGPPADIKVVVSGPQSLLLSWLPPAEPNGALTRYTVYSRVVSGTEVMGREELKHEKQTLSATQTSLEVRGLLQHTEYQFWVTASTRVGEGQSSHPVSQVPKARAGPRVASIGSVVWQPWRGSVALACRTVGQPEPRVSWRPLRGQLLDSGELMLTGLAKEHTGNYTCSAENAYGSDSITYSLFVQVPPSAPQLFIGTSTSSSVLLHWKVGDNGGAAVSGFTLHFRRQHGDPSLLDLPRRAQSHELRGLQCGTTYHMQLVAHNAVGSSARSPTLSVRTQGQAPGRPPPAALLSPGPTSLRLRLAAWPDNGCPLLYFVVRYRAVNDAQWTLVSNSLKPQRRFSINGLTPSSGYQLQVEANNIAGSATEEYTFFTLTKDGEVPAPELAHHGGALHPFYMDMRVVLPLAGAAVAMAAVCVSVALCWRTKQSRPVKPSLDAGADASAQRERYYATLRKMVQAGDKIPETSEDISPYATFQLSDSAGPQDTRLHSFMYHEQATTEAASPPPAVSKGRRGSHKSRGCGQHHDSDESDSDGDPLTSSPTESSNQPNTGPGARAGHGHGGLAVAAGLGARSIKQSQNNFIYHGAQSSTSSDISPMSEQKSLPRWGRHSRWLAAGSPARGSHGVRLPLGGTDDRLRPPPPHIKSGLPLPSPSTALRVPAVVAVPELNEAECDMDTLKKLKLGLRSSLWSRAPQPSAPGPPAAPQHSDYSIAV
ncbi:Down syndrome cell adhesion molecule-like protein Dscam2 [Frankliniella fusca]|uniref:Down syndrome cell adhesion molecule-like protein Dscam2 n=1 Tax=Frankliniella fusca TaxID=407009 RepID=A0AAE1LI34_9NEOP|nr:Down syndrome cell adhesion molecule-like protein Dscam2 [Frankliniella fusca]